jgi:hypothetical protein
MTTFCIAFYESHLFYALTTRIDQTHNIINLNHRIKSENGDGILYH